MSDSKPTGWVQTLAYIAAWILSIALLVVIMVLIRGNLMDIMTVIGLIRGQIDPLKWRNTRLTWGWIKATVDRAYLFLMSCGGIALIIAIEYYFRKGTHAGLLTKRVIRVIGVELIIGVIGWLLSLGLTALILRIPA